VLGEETISRVLALSQGWWVALPPGKAPLSNEGEGFFAALHVAGGSLLQERCHWQRLPSADAAK